MKDIRFLKLVLLINCVVPLTLLLWDVYRKQAGANPLEFVTHTTGMLTLIFLMLTLAFTPLRKITGANWLIKFRRMIGLFAFFYGLTHLITYLWFDRFFSLSSIVIDVRQRPFIAVGMIAFFLMLPLAITSTDQMVKRLGARRWLKLHRLVYVAGALGVLHYWMLVKSDTRLPLTFGFILFLLLAYRVFLKYFPPVQRSGRTTLFPSD